MKYLSVTQLAEKWCISTRRIQILCGENRIPGAVRIGHSWAIPADAEKPADARIKSGKYVKRRPAAEKSDGLPPPAAKHQALCVPGGFGSPNVYGRIRRAER